MKKPKISSFDKWFIDKTGKISDLMMQKETPEEILGVLIYFIDASLNEAIGKAPEDDTVINAIDCVQSFLLVNLMKLDLAKKEQEKIKSINRAKLN